MNTKACIYKIEFKNVDRFYIGSTNHKSRRKGQHLYQLRRDCHSNPKLQNYFNKYGEKNFVFKPIETILDPDDVEYIEEREQKYLNKYFAQEYINSDFQDKRFDDLLLNVNPEVGAMRAHWDDERRQALIERNKNYDWTPERRKKMAKKKTGLKMSKESSIIKSKKLKAFHAPKKKNRKPCPNCNSQDVAKRGKRFNKTKQIMSQRFMCNDCGKMFKVDLN